MSLEAAKQLFFNYDGSTFNMSRDGADRTYRAYAVSRETEAEWLEELISRKLGRLPFDGNWRVLTFLRHHERFDYIDQILDAEPRGESWEKCAYLETLLDYVRRGRRRGIPAEKVEQAIAYAAAWCDRLLVEAESALIRDRIRAIRACVDESRGQ